MDEVTNFFIGFSKMLNINTDNDFIVRSFNIFSVLFLTVVIGSLFMYLTLRNKKHWNKNHDGDATFLDCLYFHFVSISTIGYGDVTPNTPPAKMYTILLACVVLFELITSITMISAGSATPSGGP